MDKTNNLDIFMTDLADSIREATGETGSINAQSFSTRITGLGTGKQDKLVSGENIKTINGESILGSGDIEIVGGGGGSSSGKEIVEVIVDWGSISFTGMGGKPSFEPNKIYYGTTPVIESVSIFSVIPPTEDIGEYSLHFSYDNLNSVYFDAPSDWLWSNGIPTVESGVSYELSVVATKFGDDYIYKAVLTPFKAVE